ncbi:MAG: YfhO family protein [Candidatus Margulisiibacteriota bacterium]
MRKIDFAKKDLLVVASYFILVLLFYFRFLNGQEILAFKDLSRYFYPLRYLMVEQVKSGNLPLWNPYLYCGFPLLASLQICFFYPLTIIYYLLPFHLAFNYYIIFHYFLAACFMYVLLRNYQVSRWGSFFAGLVFAFSGYLLSVSNMNTSLSSVIWLPLVVLVWDKAITPNPIIPFPLSKGEGETKGLGVKHLLFLALLLALMFLGGEPTIFYVTFWFLLAYALVFSQEKIKSLLGLFLAVVLALGLIAVQLFPFLELARLSDRVTLTQYEVVSTRSFPPREILTFIFPYFFGNQAQLGSYTETLLGKNIQDWLITPYLGILPIVFLFFSFRRKNRRFLFYALTALFALLLAFGKYTPFYQVFYYLLPGFSLIRYPVKFLFLTTFCLVVLSALGFENLLADINYHREKFKKRSLLLFFWAAIFLGAYLFAAFYFSEIYGFFAARYEKLPPIFLERLSQIIKFDLQSLLFLVINLFILSFLFLFVFMGKVQKVAFAALVFLVVIFDLFAGNISVTLGARKEVFDKIPDSYKFLMQDKSPYRFFYTEDLEKENRMIYGENFSAALYNAKENFCANWPVIYHLYDFSGYESIRPLPLAEFIPKNLWGKNLRKNFKFLSHFNVKYIASTKKLNFPELKFLYHRYKYGVNLYLYENREVLPRAYLLGENLKPNLALGEVQIKSYRPNQVLLSAFARRPCFLFLSDSYFPGWKVYVNGQEKKILKAANLFRAVSIPAGKNEIKFIYDPLSFKVGAGISVFCLLLTAYCLLKKGG